MRDLNRLEASEEQFVPERKTLVIQSAVLFLFFFPLFFQLSGSIFDNVGMYFDSKGQLTKLPIPIATIFCFIGIGLLLRLSSSHFGMGFVFSIFIAMFFSVLLSVVSVGKEELAKFILMIQFILPMFGLVLGMLYIRPQNEYLRFEAITLYVLLLVIPGEVIATLMSGNALLSPSLYIFSLYQHLQYLPVIFVGFYFLSVVSLYESKYLRYLTIFLAPFIGVYIAASLSVLAILLAGIASLATVFMLASQRRKGFCFLVIALLWGGFTAYYPAIQSNPTYKAKFKVEQVEQVEQVGFISLLPANLRERIYYWEFYGKGIFESPKIFVFGHSKRPDRNSYPSAHNYYLDLIYHFGVISLLPFFYLIFQTIKKCGKAIPSHFSCLGFMMLMLLVSFYIFADNSLKVAFRQPYPGMMMFFLWGVLLVRLSEYENEIKAC